MDLANTTVRLLHYVGMLTYWVVNIGVNTDIVSASASCSTCRHLRGLQSEFRSLRSQLLRGSQNSKPKKIKRKPRSRSSSSSSSSSSETEEWDMRTCPS